MKKLYLLMMLILIFSGCSKKNTSNNQDSLTKYESYLNTLIEQDRYSQNS